MAEWFRALDLKSDDPGQNHPPCRCLDLFSVTQKPETKYIWRLHKVITTTIIISIIIIIIIIIISMIMIIINIIIIIIIIIILELCTVN